ncbi:MAG TPA: hypothetical protein VHA56_16195 [Mucilaginibacter sp.]|nr:hypothetical protein [Mucilaginibacter sp.]
MTNDVNLTLESPWGVDRDVIISAVHKHPKGYGIPGADFYSITDAATQESLGILTPVADGLFTYAGVGLSDSDIDNITEFLNNYTELE